jgi:hypothetical protein
MLASFRDHNERMERLRIVTETIRANKITAANANAKVVCSFDLLALMSESCIA